MRTTLSTVPHQQHLLLRLSPPRRPMPHHRHDSMMSCCGRTDRCRSVPVSYTWYHPPHPFKSYKNGKMRYKHIYIPMIKRHSSSWHRNNPCCHRNTVKWRRRRILRRRPRVSLIPVRYESLPIVNNSLRVPCMIGKHKYNKYHNHHHHHPPTWRNGNHSYQPCRPNKPKRRRNKTSFEIWAATTSTRVLA